MPDYIINAPGLFTVTDPTGGGISLATFASHGYRWITYQAVNYGISPPVTPDLAPAKGAGFTSAGIWGVVYNQADFYNFGVALGQQAVLAEAQHVIVDAEQCLKFTRPGGAAPIISGLRDGGWNGAVSLSTLGAPTNPTVNDFAMDIDSFLATGGGILPQAYANETPDYTPQNCKTYWTRFTDASNINYTIALYSGALGRIDGAGWISLLIDAGVACNFSIFLAENALTSDLVPLDAFSKSTDCVPPPTSSGCGNTWQAELDTTLLADFTANSGASVAAGELVASGSGLAYATKDLSTHCRTGHYVRFYARRVSGDTGGPIGLFRCRSDTDISVDGGSGHHTIYAFWVDNGRLWFGTPPDDVTISPADPRWHGWPVAAWSEYTTDDTEWVCVEAFWRLTQDASPAINGSWRESMMYVLVNGNPVAATRSLIGPYLPDHFDVGFWVNQGGTAREWHFDHIAVRDDPMQGLWGAFDQNVKNVFFFRGFEEGEANVVGAGQMSGLDGYVIDTLGLVTLSSPPALVASPGDRPGFALDCSGGGDPTKFVAARWGGDFPQAGADPDESGFYGFDPLPNGSRAAYSFYFYLDGYPVIASTFGTHPSACISRLLAPPMFEKNPANNAYPAGFSPPDAGGCVGLTLDGWLTAIPDQYNVTVCPSFLGPLTVAGPRYFPVNKVSLHRWHHVEVIADTIAPGAWRMWVRLNGVPFGPFVGDTSSVWDQYGFGVDSGDPSYNRWQSPPFSEVQVGKMAGFAYNDGFYLTSPSSLPIYFKDVATYGNGSFPLGGVNVRKKSPDGIGVHNAEVAEWSEGTPPGDLQIDQLAAAGANQNFDQGTWDLCGQPNMWSASANNDQGNDGGGFDTIDCVHCASLGTGNAARSFTVEAADGDEPPEIAGFNHGLLVESTFGENTMRLCGGLSLTHNGRWTVFAWVKGAGLSDWELGLSDASASRPAPIECTGEQVKQVGSWYLLRFDGVGNATVESLVFTLVSTGGGLIRKLTGVRLYFDYVESPADVGFWESDDFGATWAPIQNSDTDSYTKIDELPSDAAKQVGVSRNPLIPTDTGWGEWAGKYLEYTQEDTGIDPIAARFYAKGTGWNFSQLPPISGADHNVGIPGSAMHFRVVDPDTGISRKLLLGNNGFYTGGTYTHASDYAAWGSAMMSWANDDTAWTSAKFNSLRWRVGFQDDRSNPSAVLFSQHFELLLPEPELTPEPRPDAPPTDACGRTPPPPVTGINVEVHFRAGAPGPTVAGPGGSPISVDTVSFRAKAR